MQSGMKITKEFREFAVRGNVLDLAVGVIIGASFGKIITSLVQDVLLPPIGFLIGGIKFTEFRIRLKEARYDEQGRILSEAVTVNVGNFVQTVFDFLIIAICIFVVVKVVNSIRRSEAASPEKASAPTRQEKLLEEIRDLLKKDKDANI